MSCDCCPRCATRKHNLNKRRSSFGAIELPSRERWWSRAPARSVSAAAFQKEKERKKGQRMGAVHGWHTAATAASRAEQRSVVRASRQAAAVAGRLHTANQWGCAGDECACWVDSSRAAAQTTVICADEQAIRCGAQSLAFCALYDAPMLGQKGE